MSGGSELSTEKPARTFSRGGARRITRRERDLPKLLGFSRGDQGNKARRRDPLTSYGHVFCGSIITVHRRFIRDLYAQLRRLKTGRYCWAPARWQLAMLEADNGET